MGGRIERPTVGSIVTGTERSGARCGGPEGGPGAEPAYPAEPLTHLLRDLSSPLSTRHHAGGGVGMEGMHAPRVGHDGGGATVPDGGRSAAAGMSSASAMR